MKRLPIKSIIRLNSTGGEYGYVMDVTKSSPYEYTVIYNSGKYGGWWTIAHDLRRADIVLLTNKKRILEFFKRFTKNTPDIDLNSEHTFLEALIKNKVGL